MVYLFEAKMHARRQLQALETVRDGVIALVSSIYVIGYVTWSFYAWQHGLGVATPFNMHYFVAGVPMSVLGVGTLMATFGMKRAFDHFLKPHLQVPRRRETIKFGLSMLMLLCFGLYGGFVRYHQAVRATMGNLEVALWFIPATIGFLAAALIVFIDPPDDPTVRLLPRAGLLLAGFLYAYLFVMDLYPVIPSALGGGARRRAQLDLKAEHVSAATLSLLCACDSQGQATVRTRDLWIYPSTSDIFVATTSRADARPELIQLRPDVVSAIYWRER